MRNVSKAIAGGLIAGLSYLAPVVDNGLSASEALYCFLAAIVGFNAVYWPKNVRKGNV